MKKYRLPIIFISISILILSALSIFAVRWVNKNYWDFVFTYIAYDHIEYNGVAYYMADNQIYLSDKYDDSGNTVVAYMVDGKGRVSYSHPHEAYTYIGDDEHIHLFFDSAIFTRVDHLTPEYIKTHRVKSEYIEAAKEILNNADHKQIKE